VAAGLGSDVLYDHLHKERPPIDDFVYRPDPKPDPVDPFPFDIYQNSPPSRSREPIRLLDAVSEKLAKMPLMRRLAERMVREKPEVGGSQILDAVGRNPTLRNMLAQHVVEAAKDLGSGNVWEDYPSNANYNHLDDNKSDDQLNYKGNLAIIIRSGSTSLTKSGFDIPGNSCWDALEANDIMEAIVKVRAYTTHLPGGGKLKNLVIFMHGSPEAIKPFKNQDWGIRLEELERYETGELWIEIEDLKSHPTEKNLRIAAHYEEKILGINALLILPTLVARNGNLCIAGCNVGEPSIFGKSFLETYYELALNSESEWNKNNSDQGLGINLWASKDYVTMAQGPKDKEGNIVRNILVNTNWTEQTYRKLFKLTTLESHKKGFLQITASGEYLHHRTKSVVLSCNRIDPFALVPFNR
jgi:hypothetical protein